MVKRHNLSPRLAQRRGVAVPPTLGSPGARSDGPHSIVSRQHYTRSASAARPRKRIAFPYYGGKFVHLDFLLPLLPTHYRHFCEPFGGAASVLINRPPAPVETYNDLDSELVNFFACLRNHSKELFHRLRLTPYSREELAKACALPAALSSIERARRFFIRARQTYNSLAQASSATQWSRAQAISHRAMSGVVSRWLGGIDGLTDIVDRLQRVQIEHLPALEVIRRYDSPQTLFYCDPPYPHESRVDLNTYAFEMSDHDHEELAAALHRVRGAVAISGYRCPLLDRLYADWRRVDDRLRPCNSSKGPRKESVWMNYEPDERAPRQLAPHSTMRRDRT